MSRTIGRRHSDRYRLEGPWPLLVAGFVLGVVLVGYALYVSGCSQERITEPVVSQPAPEPVVVAPTPAATPTPKPADGEGAVSAFELSCKPGSTLSVLYNGEADRAYIETYWTPFDEVKTPNDIKGHTIARGDYVERTFQACVQGDADQPGVKEIGGCWWDVNGQPFVPSRAPQKVQECYDRCIPDVSWYEDETRTIEEWADFEGQTYGETVEEKCYKTQRRLVIVFEINRCTKARRELRRFFEFRQLEIPCPCVETNEPREIPGAYSWFPDILQGKCEVEQGPVVVPATTTPQLNCHQNGTQKFTIDWICKADTERVASLCRNVACPTPPPPTACYYTVTGQDKQAKCQAKLGGPIFDLTSGQWGKWVDSNQEHCKFPIPGIHTDLGNDFNLVPGQSHPDCNSR